MSKKKSNPLGIDSDAITEMFAYMKKDSSAKMLKDMELQRTYKVYLKTKNPIWAFKLIKIYTEQNRDLPKEILMYLYEAACRIVEFADRPENDTEKKYREISDALGIKSKFTEYNNLKKIFPFCTAVRVEMNNGLSETEAISKACDKYNISYSTGRRFYKSFPNRV